MVLIHHVPQKLNALLPLSVTSETTNSNSLLPNTVSKPQLLNPYLYTFSYSEITLAFEDDGPKSSKVMGHSIVCSNANAFTAVHFVFILHVC